MRDNPVALGVAWEPLNPAKQLRGKLCQPIVMLGLILLLAACEVPAPYPASIPTPVSVPTLSETDAAKVGLNYDLAKAALAPSDVQDLFQETSYSVRQPIGSPEMWGLVVTYPTQIIEHTSGFVEGFSTRLEVYLDPAKAAQKYDAIVAQDSGRPLSLEPVGDGARGFVSKSLTSEGYELNTTEYRVLALRQNVVVAITIRSGKDVSPVRLSELAKTVVGRLTP